MSTFRQREKHVTCPYDPSHSILPERLYKHVKKCEKVVYVGKTQNRVMDRFIGHRADLRGDDDSKPAYHFKQEGHTDADMRVIVIEEVKGKDDVYRVTRERYWINCLGTYNEENKRK